MRMSRGLENGIHLGITLNNCRAGREGLVDEQSILDRRNRYRGNPPAESAVPSPVGRRSGQRRRELVRRATVRHPLDQHEADGELLDAKRKRLLWRGTLSIPYAELLTEHETEGVVEVSEVCASITWSRISLVSNVVRVVAQVDGVLVRVANVRRFNSTSGNTECSPRT